MSGIKNMPFEAMPAEQNNQQTPEGGRKVFVAVDENGRRVGETHVRARLTDHEIDLIHELHEGGMSMWKIAAKFETAYPTIKAICNYSRRATTVARWKVLIVHPANPEKAKP